MEKCERWSFCKCVDLVFWVNALSVYCFVYCGKFALSRTFSKIVRLFLLISSVFRLPVRLYHLLTSQNLSSVCLWREAPHAYILISSAVVVKPVPFFFFSPYEGVLPNPKTRESHKVLSVSHSAPVKLLILSALSAFAHVWPPMWSREIERVTKRTLGGTSHACKDLYRVQKWLLGRHGAVCGSLRYKGGRSCSNTRHRDGYLYRPAASSLQ